MYPAKYIVWEDSSGFKNGIVFPANLSHQEVWGMFQRQWPGYTLVSAGFVRWGWSQEKFQVVALCSGKSDSLKVAAKPNEDSTLLSRVIVGMDSGEVNVG